MTADDLGIAERLKRKMGRPARTQSVATRFTKPEELELLKAAERTGQTLREWTRDALLREARRPEDDPVFTEIIATRLLLNDALRFLLAGENLTAEQFAKMKDTVRTLKRKVAKEIMEQYAPRDES